MGEHQGKDEPLEEDATTIPEVTIEGPPQDIVNDPWKLKIYNAIQDGYDAAVSGERSKPPVDLTGDEMSALAYEVGYRFGKGEPLPDRPTELDDWYTGPTVEGPVGGKPYPDSLTPATRALLKWLGAWDEDPHIEIPEYDPDSTRPTPIETFPVE
jgi:hypothetical protein